jgi:hypothetical protein
MGLDYLLKKTWTSSTYKNIKKYLVRTIETKKTATSNANRQLSKPKRQIRDL